MNKYLSGFISVMKRRSGETFQQRRADTMTQHQPALMRIFINISFLSTKKLVFEKDGN